jgi:hypothetical protein
MKSEYTDECMEILYFVFRHKIAHLAYPYPVTTISHRRVTWTVYATGRRPSIALVDYKTRQYLTRSVRPWPVWYNCRAQISIYSFRVDIVQSVYGKNGYLRYLEVEPQAREKFARCMNTFFPS